MGRFIGCCAKAAYWLTKDITQNKKHAKMYRRSGGRVSAHDRDWYSSRVIKGTSLSKSMTSCHNQSTNYISSGHFDTRPIFDVFQQFRKPL
ncbi:MAG TPA: hypothetical protein DCP67_08340 [Planctomycetaceae bacterium]|nr:hypothetical protein [Rhodopirellula sp.]HAL13810.1 hypothetical protein [Planctomycetaceae bacterium]HCK72743.1 hypothetical protein [Planctomycetaceae bacterium]HCP84917.1 hypothetical protein [Planctomycetaceae bacterium]